MQLFSRCRGFTSVLVWGMVLSCSTQLSAQAGKLRLPPIPADGSFIQDYADLLDDDTRAKIGEFQRAAYADNQTPIVVVTINSRAKYLGAGMTIEQFAQAWFDHWELGVRDQGMVKNKAILVLISVQDRKSRIELGADWARHWDGHCSKIMQSQMVPQFKEGNYAQGALNGVAQLGAMAELGPKGNLPFALPKINWDKPPFPGSPVPLWGVAILFPLSACCFIAAWFFEDFRTQLIWAGIGLFVIGLMLWIALAVLAFWGKGRYGNNHSFGGGFGGGFGSGGGGGVGGGGGFSGGGGATGSW
ncbi:MAG: hypothetical protein ACI87E_004109 [Mariniblastus sp.]|jgi:uncharacterized protein